MRILRLVAATYLISASAFITVGVRLREARVGFGGVAVTDNMVQVRLGKPEDAVGTVFLDGAVPGAIDARKGEGRLRVFAILEREPMPASWFAFVGLAEGGCRYQAAALLKTILWALSSCVLVTHLGA